MKKIYEDQIVAGFVQQGIQEKETLLVETLREIEYAANKAASNADKAFSAACTCVENVRDFVASPSNILGNVQTKHGEIAEHVQVEITNGRRILQGLSPNASLDVGRTAPEDYLVDGIKVQSKFIQSPKGTLDAVIEHSHKYPFFISEEGYYHIPKDQYEIFTKIANGENVEGLKLNTILSIKQKISQIEAETGKSFVEVVRPGISNYKEVQIGAVGKTLDGYEEEFSQTNTKNHQEIREEEKKQIEEANHITDASWGEALKYCGISAAITGSVSASINVYSKIKSGKKLDNFTLEDWKDVGYDFTNNAVKGGISGLSIYGLTKLGGFSAPFAGAITSSAMGIASLVYDYKLGKITLGDFCDSANALSVEAGVAAIGSAIGQVAIPVPVLGAIIGSAVAKSALMVTKHVIGDLEDKLIKEMNRTYEESIEKLNANYKLLIEKIIDSYNQLGGLIEASMNIDVNKRLSSSVELAEFLNIEEKIYNIAELDDFILGVPNV